MTRPTLTLVNAGPNVPRHQDGRLLKPPPLGVLSLAAYLNQRGHDVQILDYQLNEGSLADQLSDDRLAAWLEENVRSEVLGISTMGGMLPVVLLALRQYRARHPKTTVILGGAGPSGVARDILTHFDCVDVVVRGEGEETLAELLTPGVDPSAVTGITYRDHGDVQENRARPRIRDIQRLPMPAYSAVDMERYSVANVITARGCPFSCSFCEIPSFWGRGVCQRDLDSVLQEIAFLHRTCGKRQISISDDVFVMDRERVQTFCHRLGEEGLEIRWECFGRVDLMDEQLMGQMSECGCAAVFFGIESGSDCVLDAIGKRITVAQIRDVIGLALENFDTVYTSFIWGFPFETMEDFYDTVLLMREFASMGARVQRPYLSLRPECDLYRRYRDRMVFADDLPLYFLEVPRQYIPDRVLSLIRKHLPLFPGYCYVDGPEFLEKKRFMETLESLGEKRWDILHEYLNEAYEDARHR